jgi:hypothetical protein
MQGEQLSQFSLLFRLHNELERIKGWPRINLVEFLLEAQKPPIVRFHRVVVTLAVEEGGTLLVELVALVLNALHFLDGLGNVKAVLTIKRLCHLVLED